MKIASAQLFEEPGDISSKIDKHLKLIHLAASNGVALTVFPEMSLTGYTVDPDPNMIFDVDDKRLDSIKQAATFYKMMVVVGAPIKLGEKKAIGSFIFMPDGSVSMYTKQNLHAGEEKFDTTNGLYNPVLVIGKETVCFSICADITNPLHPSFARKHDATLYVASIFYSDKGITEAYDQLSNYAAKYSLNILMSNYACPGYSSQAAGKSAFWNNQGVLLEQLGKMNEGLLLVEKTTDSDQVYSCSCIISKGQ